MCVDLGQVCWDAPTGLTRGRLEVRSVPVRKAQMKESGRETDQADPNVNCVGADRGVGSLAGDAAAKLDRAVGIEWSGAVRLVLHESQSLDRSRDQERGKETCLGAFGLLTGC